MGGVPLLGYRVCDRKLVIVNGEAEIVRTIFCRYAELGSVRSLKEELEAGGLRSKSWTSASGRLISGKPFSRGALYLILQNRLYPRPANVPGAQVLWRVDGIVAERGGGMPDPARVVEKPARQHDPIRVALGKEQSR